MKKLHNKIYVDKQAKKHHLHNLRRKDKEYKGNFLVDMPLNKDSFVSQNKHTTKKLETPEEFSFIYNIDESLKFFNDFVYYSKHVDFIQIDMKKTKEMTMEVLLYLISLQKINRSQKIQISVMIKPPRERKLIELMSQSGFSKYFKAKIEVPVDTENIFEIQDKESNKKSGMHDEETCKRAVDFTLRYHPNYKYSDEKFRQMYNALAEMMTNTDNHAYNKNGELRNWYLFAVKLEGGLSFYFFDNGKGVLETAKKNILESTIGKVSFSLGYESLMKATLDGQYRSATGKKHRNKGLPQINDFLTSNSVSLPIIITNKIYCHPEKGVYKKNRHNFSGTLFVWVLKDEEDAA